MLTTTIALAEDHRNQRLEEAPMHRLAQITAERSRRRRRDRGGAEGTQPPGGRRWPMAVGRAGLALIGLSASALALHLNGPDTSAIPEQPVRAAATQLADVVTADLVYEPGHSSGWHVHSGVHSVVVLSGTLTVYDQACGRQDYGPGQIYLGGREPHLARNSTAEATHLVVTYVADPSTSSPGNSVAGPNGCEAA